jgi:hypothetical protein
LIDCRHSHFSRRTAQFEASSPKLSLVYDS